MSRFDAPWLLLLLLLVPPLVLLRYGRRSRPAANYSSLMLTDPAPKSLRQLFLWILPTLRTIALAAIIVAIARPQTGIGQTRTTVEGVAMMIVVDRSWSMSEEIEYEGRLMPRIEVAKRVFEEFVSGNEKDLHGRPHDLIGLVTFAGLAETVCPLVQIHDTLVELVKGVELAPTQGIEAGTAIGDGLALAAARLKKAEDVVVKGNEGAVKPEFTIRSKIIVLMTDGDENRGQFRAEQSAQLCAEWGIKIYAIGIGGGGGMTIQTPLGQRRLGPRYPFDEQLLKEVATTTGGMFRFASDGDSLRKVYEEIDRLEKTRIESTQFTNYEEEFAPWAIGGLIGLLVECVLGMTILRRSP